MSKTKDESVARLKESRTPRDYFWFGPETVKWLVEEVKEQGGAENVVLRVYPGLDTDGSPDLWLQIENLHTKDCGECKNFSHPCPPDCG